MGFQLFCTQYSPDRCAQAWASIFRLRAEQSNSSLSILQPTNFCEHVGEFICSGSVVCKEQLFAVYALQFRGALEPTVAATTIRDVTLCGVSIGGAIALIMAGRRNPRVGRVVAINPYDYAKGRGMTRSSLLGWMITMTSENRLSGGTVMRLRNFIMMKAVLQGGVANLESIRPELLKEMYMVGNRRGHYRAFISLLRNAMSWEAATKTYGNIDMPAFLIWGDKDWSRARERERDRSLIPGAQMVTVENGGHFLPLDRPGEVEVLTIRFAGS